MRSRALRYFVSLVAVAGTLVAGGIEPAVAHVEPGPDGPAVLAACDAPPASPDATPENSQRFVDAWLPRMRNEGWIQDFVRGGAVPQDIRAEGFHAMDEDTQIWLVSCLVDAMLDVADERPSANQLNHYLMGANLVIFGKEQIAEIKESLTTSEEAPPLTTPVHEDMTAAAVDAKTQAAISEPSLTSSDLPRSGAEAPSARVANTTDGAASPQLKRKMNAPAMEPEPSQAPALEAPLSTPTALALPPSLLQVFPVPQLLAAIDAILQLVAKIQGVLFTLPVLNLLASAFYKICAESPTMPLKCSASLPVGIPIPADVTGDNFPDVLGWLGPLVGNGAVGAKFQITRLFPGSGKLPAHVFAVYDPPVVKKRIQFGVDGRADTLADRTETTFQLHNVLKALSGDVRVSARVRTWGAGSAHALTFGVKSLVGGSTGVPPSEADPMTGAVQFSPVPPTLIMDAHLTHTNTKNQDTFHLESDVPTRVDAVIDQSTTTTTPKSHRRFTALVDKLPESVTVDVVGQGEHQSIDYTASAPIAHVQASDTATPDVSEPGSYTRSVYDVLGVPDAVSVDLVGAKDITYAASATIPEVSFETQTFKNGTLQQQISAAAHGVPKSIHVTNLTTEDQTSFTYDADSELQDVQLSMYDLNEVDETNLQARAEGIPTHMEFTQTKSTGVYDFSANDGIDLIEAKLSRNGGLVLPVPGDHATVLKQGDALGLDFRLSGFKSAHFDGHEDTNVALGLSPGGQSFTAIADLDDPNVLAKAYISALPSSMEVTFDPDNGTADYTASSVIPLLQASFTDRDSEMSGEAILTALPKNIGLTFNTSGDTPEVTYDADSRLGSIELTYSEKPGGLGIHGLISNLPQYMRVSGLDPIVFDARTGPDAASGSSDIGQIRFEYASDGVFAAVPTPDDHVYLNTTGGGTRAGLQYSGLAYLSVDTSNEELHAEVRNSAPRMFRAFLTTPTLTLTGLIDKVPARINLDQVGNQVTYTASHTVARIYTNLARDNGDTLAVDIQGVPNSVNVLFDGAASKLGWVSSSPVGSISADAHLTPATLGGSRAFDASLTITSIPTQWNASWANGNVLFQAPGGIGSIEAQVTNHGTTHTLDGDHLHAYYRQGSEDLDASLRISNLRRAQFTKLNGGNGGGFEAALQMGNHGTFNFGADVVIPEGVLRASGQFSNLPSDLLLRSENGRITYNGDSNPNLTVAVEAGTSQAALDNTPAAPSVHGVAVRDGASGADRAVKARLHLTGLPDHLDLDSPAGTYKVNGYHPSNPTLVVDVALTELTPEDLTLYLTQGVPTAAPVDFTFGPFLSDTLGNGTHTMKVTYTATQDLGALNANATYGAPGVGDEAQLYISEIPGGTAPSIVVSAEFAASTKHVNVAMSHDIGEITAKYKRKGAAQFAASVTLRDVPKTVDLLIGRAAGSDGTTDVAAPDFTLKADHAGLDVFATATAKLVEPEDIHAAATLDIENMGHLVTGALNGTTLNIASQPHTDKFLLIASGGINIDVDLGFSVLDGFIQNTGNLNIDFDLKQLTLGFEHASTLQLDLGITTGLKGDYSTFTFSEDSKTVATIEDELRLVASLPFGFPDLDWKVVDINPTSINFNNVISSFRLASNTYDVVWSLRVIDIGIGTVDAQILARPHAERTTGGPVPGFTVEQPPSDGTNPAAWLITPNPNVLGVTLPDFVVDVVQYFTTPYGHQIGGRLWCDAVGFDPGDCTP